MSRALLLALLATGCPGGAGKDTAQPGDSVPTDDSAAGDTGPSAGSTSCYVDVQFICDELPDATETDAQNLAVSCSSRSGVYAQPADCPTDGYEGKCSVGSGTAETVQRFYTGADVTYAADFCVNTAGGTWTTDW